ncbi:hypothetical protein [Collimonas sp.]|jgi:hypothetical protein|uniref:hypothetical protein n=1 Tax=Collimonas sp. TaxID=1963772 RepID=UPI002BC9D946|nr:hypothetical protein [Collimonas sp.]HWX03195.1 hypothetical protein [Collimonas sp.]
MTLRQNNKNLEEFECYEFATANSESQDWRGVSVSFHAVNYGETTRSRDRLRRNCIRAGATWCQSSDTTPASAALSALGGIAGAWDRITVAWLLSK